jgi:hypothetical protein
VIGQRSGRYRQVLIVVIFGVLGVLDTAAYRRRAGAHQDAVRGGVVGDEVPVLGED